MPANIVKSFADKTGKSVGEVEKLWNKAKAIAKDEGHEEDYDYITGILKKMLSLNENSGLRPFREIVNEGSKIKSQQELEKEYPIKNGWIQFPKMSFSKITGIYTDMERDTFGAAKILKKAKGFEMDGYKMDWNELSDMQQEYGS